jgi:hypothetical protein
MQGIVIVLGIVLFDVILIAVAKRLQKWNAHSGTPENSRKTD